MDNLASIVTIILVVGATLLVLRNMRKGWSPLNFILEQVFKPQAVYVINGKNAKLRHLSLGIFRRLPKAGVPRDAHGQATEIPDFYALEIPLTKNYGTLFISSDSDQANALIDLSEYKEIKLESAEFNQKFDLYAPKESISWEFFAPNVMSYLIDNEFDINIHVSPGKLIFYQMIAESNKDRAIPLLVQYATEVSRMVD